VNAAAKRQCERRRTACGGKGPCLALSPARRAKASPGDPRTSPLLAGRRPPPSYRRLAVLAPNTHCGKSYISALVVRGLREAGERVWVHKPVSCGDWRDGTAGDGRDLLVLAGDGQDPATICPRQFPEACSPHLAAELAGERFSLADLVRDLPEPPAGTWLVCEGAGGVLTPLSRDRGTNADWVAALDLPVLLVTTPDLGTISVTSCSVEALQRRAIPILGLVVSHVRPGDGSVAVARAAEELTAATGLPVLGEVPHGGCDAAAGALAAAVSAAMTRACATAPR
jgi:dethiobiotin synthetase